MPTYFTIILRARFDGSPDVDLVKDVAHRLLVNADPYLVAHGADVRVERVVDGVTIKTDNLNDIAFPRKRSGK